MELENSRGYFEILQQLKEKIRNARLRANISVNTELLKIYWEIGNAINEQQSLQKWGSKIIEKLVADLRSEFEDMKGLSPRNLHYMRNFAKSYPAFPILQQPVANSQSDENEAITILQRSVAKLPWGHNCTLLDRTDNTEKRLFYAQKTVENGWSRDMLINQIESGLYESTGTLSNNFAVALPKYDSELAMQLFKDPYHLEFIRLSEKAKEKDLEDALMSHVIKFLLELGDGFAFVGRQRRFEIGGQEYFIDLLFYHTKLRRHIVIELKIGEFKPEFVSKMNLYLGIVDDTLKHAQDEPAVGLILCKTKNKVVAEYALRDTNKPIGIAEYRIGALLPEDIKSELPTIEQIEQKIDQDLKEIKHPTNTRLQLIREKINSIGEDKTQTEANPSALLKILDGTLAPLHKQITDTVQLFARDFHDVKFVWTYDNKTGHSLTEFETKWRDDISADKDFYHEPIFQFDLIGFKKAGLKKFNVSIRLVLLRLQYWYHINFQVDLVQLVSIKKLYHQQITTAEIAMINDLILNKLIDRIEEFMKE